jgi:hypothetical protein
MSSGFASPRVAGMHTTLAPELTDTPTGTYRAAVVHA